MQFVNPFTADDKRAIEESIRLIDDMSSFIAKAKACGTQCDELINRLNAARKRLSAFRTQFFPEDI